MPDTATHLSVSASHEAGRQAGLAATPAAPSASGLRMPVPVPVLGAELMAQRDYLVHFARRRLQDDLALAEDAVHDVFEAVLSGRATFEGRAALRSWLTAILKNKVVDVIRQRARFDSLDARSNDGGGEESELAPLACGTAGPEEIAAQRELLRDALARIAKLPAGLRDAMLFRVVEDESSGAVCRRLNISEASLFVRLHRARRRLLC